MFVSQVRSLEQDVATWYRYEEMADKIPSTDFSLRQNDVLLYVGADARLCCLPKRIKHVAQLFYALRCHFGASDTVTDQGREFIQ